MRCSARLSKEARQDIDEAKEYLEDCRKGLAEAFAVDFDMRINEICQNPYICQKRYGRYRMAVTSRFHYKIFYSIVENSIDIVAVWHSKRHPTSWMSRL